jgi:sirohydrochlorin ferrochelatase
MIFRFSRRLLVLGMSALMVLAATRHAAAAENGILLLAHGTHSMGPMPATAGAAVDRSAHANHGPAAPSTWNDNIEAIARGLNKDHPTEVAFGMAEPQAMQDAVERLEKRGVTNIVAIPLYVSSHSPIIGNFRYILRLQDKLGLRTNLKELARIRSKATFSMSGAMDAHPLVSEILYDRAKALSPAPAKTNLVIIAHGPNAEEDNKLWLIDMAKHAEYLKGKGFRGVEVLTHRNDAGPEIKAAARAAFRDRVEEAGRDGNTVVIPLLLSEGGVEAGIEADLKGLKYTFGKPLAPHPNLARWVKAQYEALAR